MGKYSEVPAILGPGAGQLCPVYPKTASYPGP